MKILVINGDCILTNTSANLCHLAYIRGLVDSGYDVTLLSADGRDYLLDPSMQIPPKVKQYTYYGMTLYEKISKITGKKIGASSINVTVNNKQKKHTSIKNKIIRKAKKGILSLYGAHGIYAKFVKKAQAFRSSEQYDYI